MEILILLFWCVCKVSIKLLVCTKSNLLGGKDHGKGDVIFFFYQWDCMIFTYNMHNLFIQQRTAHGDGDRDSLASLTTQYLNKLTVFRTVKKLILIWNEDRHC